MVFGCPKKNERTLDFSFPDDNQAFGLRTKLRLLRINQLYEAEKISQNGKMAFVDGYYDKLMYFY